MSLTLTDAVADLIKTWDNCHSNDPISEIWDELVAVDKAWKLATTPAEINPGKTADLVGTPVEYPSSPRPVKKEPTEHDDNLPGMSNREIQARFGLILTKEQAERDFLEASIAVWREIDRLMIVGPYPGIPMAADLRIMEKLAWERYRSFLEPAGDSSSPQVTPDCPQCGATALSNTGIVPLLRTLDGQIIWKHLGGSNSVCGFEWSEVKPRTQVTPQYHRDCPRCGANHVERPQDCPNVAEVKPRTGDKS